MIPFSPEPAQNHLAAGHENDMRGLEWNFTTAHPANQLRTAVRAPRGTDAMPRLPTPVPPLPKGKISHDGAASRPDLRLWNECALFHFLLAKHPLS